MGILSILEGGAWADGGEVTHVFPSIAPFEKVRGEGVVSRLAPVSAITGFRCEGLSHVWSHLMRGLMHRPRDVMAGWAIDKR